MRLNDYVSKCEKWTEQQINERAKQLSQLSLKCWPEFETTFTPQKNHELTYSIDDDQTFKSSKIESYEFKGKEYSVQTWTDFYKQVIHFLYEENSSVFASITNELNFSSDLALVISKSKDNALRNSFKITDGLYIELNLNTDSKLKTIRNLLTYFDQEEINLRFTIKQDDLSKYDADSNDLVFENQPRGISKEQWINVLNNPKIFFEENIEIISAIYNSSGYKLSPSYLAEELGINYPSLNWKIVKLGLRIVNELEIPDQIRLDGSKRYWNIAFLGEYDDDDHIIWTLRNELVSAINEIGEGKFEKISIKTLGKKSSIVDRYDWVIRSSEKSLSIVDKFLDLINKEFSGYELKYNQPYIGLQKNGKVNNFMIFFPRKKPYILVQISLKKSKQFDNIFDKIGVKSLEYIEKEGAYRFRIDYAKVDSDSSSFSELIKHAEG